MSCPHTTEELQERRAELNTELDELERTMRLSCSVAFGVELSHSQAKAELESIEDILEARGEL